MDNFLNESSIFKMIFDQDLNFINQLNSGNLE